MISFPELAKLAGVSRGAVSLWIKFQREHSGVELVAAVQDKKKFVDGRNPLIRKYIANALEKPRRPGKPAAPGSDTPVAIRFPDTLRKLAAQVEKLRIRTQDVREKYIARDLCVQALEKQHELEEKCFSTLPGEIFTGIEKSLKITITENAQKSVKKLITDAIKKALQTTERYTHSFINETAAKHTRKRHALPDLTQGELVMELSALRDAKEKAIADELEVRNAIQRGDLITRNVYLRTVGNTYSTYSSQVIPLSETLGPIIASILGIKDLAEEIATIREIMADRTWAAMSGIKKNMASFFEGLKKDLNKN